LKRDVEEPTTGVLGLTFSQPDFYDGLRFGGLPDDLDTTTGGCSQLRIVINDGTTTISGIRKLFPEKLIQPIPTGMESHMGLLSSVYPTDALN
jgi:hypothetical protein